MLVLVVNGQEELAIFLHSEMKLQYFEAVLSSKAAWDFARGHMSALLHAPPVWYLVQHSESVLLNFGMPGGTLPLGKIASHFSFGLILAHGRSWVLVASFFRSFGFSSWSDFLCFFFVVVLHQVRCLKTMMVR